MPSYKTTRLPHKTRSQMKTKLQEKEHTNTANCGKLTISVVRFCQRVSVQTRGEE